MIWTSASAPDADLVAMLSDVAPDGSSKLVSQGYLNLPRAPDPSTPRALEQGVIHRYELELFPLSYVFAAGHRVRLTLAGAAVAQPGETAPQGPGPHPHAFALTLYQDAEHTSLLELPVIGTALGPVGVD